MNVKPRTFAVADFYFCFLNMIEVNRFSFKLLLSTFENLSSVLKIIEKAKSKVSAYRDSNLSNMTIRKSQSKKISEA